jgi:hypothetical protein
MKAQRGNRGSALLFPNLGARCDRPSPQNPGTQRGLVGSRGRYERFLFGEENIPWSHRGSNLGSSNPQRVTIPTTLSRLPLHILGDKNYSGWVASNVITLVPNFVKVGQLFHSLTYSMMLSYADCMLVRKEDTLKRTGQQIV